LSFKGLQQTARYRVLRPRTPALVQRTQSLIKILPKTRLLSF